MKRLLLALSLLILLSRTSGCSFSCFQSKCDINGGTNPRCDCVSKRSYGLTGYVTECEARGATSCERTDFRFGCDIEGSNVRCDAYAKSYGLNRLWTSRCEATRAHRCSFQAYGRECSVVGEDATCHADLVESGLDGFIVGSCSARQALQCSVKCDQNSCSKTCDGSGRRWAKCQCVVQKLDTFTTIVVPKCECSR
ncbi:hypothetical protein GEMRC1_012545 [Eukaryota sp. GEM-RC1]